LARSCCCCATAHCHATAAAEPPSGQEKRGDEGREEGDPRADPSRGPREEETARLVS